MDVTAASSILEDTAMDVEEVTPVVDKVIAPIAVEATKTITTDNTITFLAVEVVVIEILGVVAVDADAMDLTVEVEL